MKFRLIFSFVCFLILSQCTNTRDAVKSDGALNVQYEKFTLDNGLQVIFHIDRSDPVVAVALTSHVGSAREKTGRTGFAHLFEHLLFLESENLGKGGLDKLSARIGGSGANGSTSRDRTNYYQTVPNDALEKMIWAEADKLGFFINTVSEQVLAKEKQVVKNEKRQSVDNQPYGHTEYVIDKNLYPANHPYSWQVIGSLEDLQNATLEDVKEFFGRWYVPNNVTLSVAGDFDVAQAKQWVEKYFGEIKKGEEIPSVDKTPVQLTETKKLYHEDNFANLPELTLTWPGVPLYEDDGFALEILTEYLSEGKKAPLYKSIVEEKQFAPSVDFYNYNSELAGQIMLSVRAFENTDLNKVHETIFETFSKFEKDGISDADLKRIKASREVGFYNSISSVLGKGFQLAQYNIFTGDPGFINQYVGKVTAVTKEDVIRVYDRYIKGKSYVATSFVPKGQTNLVLKDSKKAEVVEEQIVQGAEEQFDASEAATYEKTRSSFDRTVEPPYGKTPSINTPAIWKDSVANGMKVIGISSNEVPMVQFNLRVRGGLYLDEASKPGVANLFAQMLTKGTKDKTPEQLEEAIQLLGAVINASTGDEFITISGSTLSRNFYATMDLVSEMILQPRWDEKELTLAKQRVISQLQQQQANPNGVASLQFKKIIYGKDHILSNSVMGSESAVSMINMNDVQKYYNEKFSPSLSSLLIVGDVSKDEVVKSLSGLSSQWKSFEVTFPEYPMASSPDKSKVYFYDIPGAKQSVLRFGYPALAATDPDFYAVEVMNYILGGGGFASQLTQQLREGKGYTYGIFSNFDGSRVPGPFMIASGVRSNVTLEAAQLVKDILQNYGKNYNENDLEVTKSFLVKSNARAFETGNSKLGMLMDISDYGWPDDYVKRREETVNTMTVDKIRSLTDKYIRPDKMYYLVVGDAASQKNRLKALGFGEPVMISNEKPIPIQLK
jgi:zinc protease